MTGIRFEQEGSSGCCALQHNPGGMRWCGGVRACVRPSSHAPAAKDVEDGDNRGADAGLLAVVIEGVHTRLPRRWSSSPRLPDVDVLWGVGGCKGCKGGERASIREGPQAVGRRE